MSTQKTRSSHLAAFHWGDVIAGISVALVAIPQSLAYAELAGMPAYTGLYALALPAAIAAFFVSSPYLQTGPTALTALLVLSALSPLAPLASTEYIALAALLALLVGIIRIAIGVLGFGAIAYLLSQPVLMGFTTAAAILIIASQLPAAVGLSPSIEGVLQQAGWIMLHPLDWNIVALSISIITIIIIILGRRLHHLFPGVLVSAVLGLALSSSLPLGVDLIGDIPTGLPRPNFQLPFQELPGLLLSALVIALIGFAEAASIARTYANQDRSIWSANQEFISQGFANVAAGLFAAFPVGASFSRSSINRLAGAQTRWSGLITGLVVFSLLPFIGILANLPRAILAAIVIAAILNLLKLPQLIALWQVSHSQAIVAWITFVLTLALSPRIDLAVTIGIALAIGQHLRREQQLIIEHWVYDHTLHIKPKGVLWFGSAASLQERFGELLGLHPDIQSVILHLGGLGRIDFSAAVMLQRLLEDAQALDLDITLDEVPPMAQSWVERIWKDALDNH